MKIFIAGASGAIGSHLVPQLVARGHEIVGTTRSAAKTEALRALGAAGSWRGATPSGWNEPAGRSPTRTADSRRTRLSGWRARLDDLQL
jgi:nucleoside-diphosphate-sugar epimerase